MALLSLTYSLSIFKRYNSKKAFLGALRTTWCQKNSWHKKEVHRFHPMYTWYKLTRQCELFWNHRRNHNSVHAQ